MWMWVALAVIAALIIGVASWLVLRSDPTSTPSPTPAQSTAKEPASEQPTTEQPETDQPATTEPSDPTPVSTAPGEAVMLPPPGTIIEPIDGCPTTASDAVGEQGDDGRYTSGAGLSMPAADGFEAAPVQFPWVHESNSQVKQYGGSWMAAVTVGTVRPDDGFTDTTTTAVALVACMLGSDFYASVDPVATVGNASRSDEYDVVALSVDVTVQGVENVNSDLLYVMTTKVGEVTHVVISTVPDTDRAATDAVGAVVADVKLR